MVRFTTDPGATGSFSAALPSVFVMPDKCVLVPRQQRVDVYEQLLRELQLAGRRRRRSINAQATSAALFTRQSHSDRPAPMTRRVYDPTAGFVTGGGWINSPAGAYAADPRSPARPTSASSPSTRRARTSRRATPSSSSRSADLNFQSTVYEWLVVAGARAQYKGTGTINGAGDYGFMLTAIDGQVNGGGGTDKFRIKIWDK